MRGRGRSDYASDSATYTPLHYVADLKALLEQEGIERFIAIGTSLGGLMTMLLALEQPERIAAAALVDVGPEIDAEGIARIREYVGQGGSFPTWIHAARALQEVHGAVHPQFTLDDWLAMAKRLMVLGANGRIAYDYDMRIAEPFNTEAAPPAADLWPAFEALVVKLCDLGVRFDTPHGCGVPEVMAFAASHAADRPDDAIWSLGELLRKLSAW